MVRTVGTELKRGLEKKWLGHNWETLLHSRAMLTVPSLGLVWGGH